MQPLDAIIVHLQELLLILEDHWRRNKEMQGVPIYQASGLATKALSVYQAYIEMMNEDIRIAFDEVAHHPMSSRVLTLPKNLESEVAIVTCMWHCWNGSLGCWLHGLPCSLIDIVLKGLAVCC